MSVPSNPTGAEVLATMRATALKATSASWDRNAGGGIVMAYRRAFFANKFYGDPAGC
jgi:hypothetical protein